MTDPIETRLFDYFGQLRPNPALPAEARLVAALDRAAAKPATVPFFSRSMKPVLRGGAQRLALLATAAIVIAAVAGTYGLSTVRSGPGATSPSPSAGALATQSATPSAPPSPAAILTPSPTEPLGPSSLKPAASRMTEWRLHAVAAPLLDGRVLIVGGNSGGGDDQDLASAELFDPKTNTFSATGSMYQQHGRQATATLLADGRVLVVGGADHDGMKPSSDAELYDPSTGKFTETGQTTEPAWYHTATRLRDGRVLILNSDQVFTSINQTGNEVLAGGHSQIYDPATGKFTPSAPMKTIAMPEVAIVLGDGQVLVVGEQANGSGAGPATAELFDPASGTFVSAGPLAFQPSSVVGTVMTDGRVLIAGGGVIQIFDPSTGKFTRAGTLSSSQAMQQVIALPDGHVLVTYSDPGDPSTGPMAAEVFNPATGKTTRTGPMIEDRLDFTATLMSDGRVLIAGGALNYRDHNVGELFDPGTNTFRATGP